MIASMQKMSYILFSKFRKMSHTCRKALPVPLLVMWPPKKDGLLPKKCAPEYTQRNLGNLYLGMWILSTLYLEKMLPT